MNCKFSSGYLFTSFPKHLRTLAAAIGAVVLPFCPQIFFHGWNYLCYGELENSDWPVLRALLACLACAFPWTLPSNTGRPNERHDLDEYNSYRQSL